MHALLLFIAKYSYLGVFIALSLGILGLPVPDESIIAFTGFLSSEGRLDIESILIVIITGVFLGITVSYFLGKLIGSYVSIKFSGRPFFTTNHFRKTKVFYTKYGRQSLLFGFFIPGVKHLIALFAGLNNMPYRQFALFAYSGAFLWTGTFFTLGFWLGDNWHYVTHYYFAALIILIVIILILFLKLRKKN